MEIRDRCHLKGGVRQGCFQSLILNYLIQYIHFHSLYITSHYHAKFKENPCVGTDARPPLFDFVEFQNDGPIMNFLSVFTPSMFCDVRVCYRLIDVAVKAMHTTSQLILLESLFSVV